MNRSDMPAMPFDGSVPHPTAHPAAGARKALSTTGLTIRETFILHAMQGLLSNSVMGDADLHDSPEEWVDDITDSAITFADAQIEKMERNND